MLDTFKTSQADYQAAIADKKMTVSPSMLDYLDVFHCEDIGSGLFECYAYQPDWHGDKASDGYPRLGRGDAVRAATIWGSMTEEGKWDYFGLESATSLAACLYTAYYMIYLF